AEGAEDFTRRMGVVKRRDQRLNYADGAVKGARITPALQVVRLRDVPLALFGSFVEIEADVDGVADFGGSQLGDEIEIVGSIVNGVATENQQSVDLTSFNVGAQFAQGLQMICRIGFHGLG